MPSDTRRVMLSVTPPLARSLRILGLNPEPDDDANLSLAGATQITATIGRYADAVERASRELDRLLKPEEWNFLADSLNGCADVWEWSETPIGSMHLILANADDAQRLNGTGDKWFGEETRPGNGGKKTAELLKKLRGLTQIHGDAILAATRYFWSHYQEAYGVEDKWWTIEWRTGETPR